MTELSPLTRTPIASGPARPSSPMPSHERFSVRAPEESRMPSDAFALLLIASPDTDESPWRVRIGALVVDRSPTHGSLPAAFPQPSIANCFPALPVMLPAVAIVVFAGRLK